MRPASAVLGLVLAGAAAGWTVVTGDANPGSRAGPVLAWIATAAGAAVLGSLLARLSWILAPLAVVTGAASVALVAQPDGNAPDGGPFGYANATGSVLAVGALAAAAIAATRWWLPGRVLAGMGAGALAAAVVVSGSAAALALLPVGAAVLAAGSRSSSWGALLGGAVVAATLLGTVALAAGAGEREPTGGVDTRLALWRGALETAADEPLTGVGPGRFEVVNPVTDDRDIRFAHHGVLQQAAEQGVIGAFLLVAATAVGFIRAGRAPGTAGALAAASLTVLAVHSTIDYVLRYAGVVAAVALLLGAALPQAHQPRPRRSATSR